MVSRTIIRYSVIVTSCTSNLATLVFSRQRQIVSDRPDPTLQLAWRLAAPPLPVVVAVDIIPTYFR